MRLYDGQRVEQTEAGPEFVAARTKAARRSEIAQQAADHHRAQPRRPSRLAITVPVMDRKDLIERSCRTYNRLEAGLFDENAGPDSDPAFIERITVNHIRHDLTEYDQALEDKYSHVGGDAAKARIRERVYEAIARTYPHLAEERRRQEHRHINDLTYCWIPQRKYT
ncbi:hypothetical protein [Streptomyces mirabilis]|uniref:hypothetical protein n=1 Tax=Streptomyces mirabilis TaxID=68239 RepID=UPI0036B607B5